MTMPVQSRLPPVARTQGPDLAKVKIFLLNAVTHEFEINPPAPEQREEKIKEILVTTYAQTRLALPESIKAQIFHDIHDDLLGYGPIQPLLEDPTITEVMVNRYNLVYIERNGKLMKTNVAFEDDAHILRVIERIVLPLGRRVDADSPTVDARLPDGSRVNAVIPPVAIDGPSLTIRKFSREKLTVEQLIEYGSLTKSMADFLRACVLARLNIVISGGTGSGKTTLLNVLSSYIPENERIVTIEDAAELRLDQEHIVRLESKPASVEGRGTVTIRDLVRNSLRMRPDRIVVGECRGGEALDMLQAMNTGHDGSLTTIHSNSPRDALSRLETLTLMAGMDLPLRVVREQIASAVDLVVQTSRLKDGSRKVTAITEVAGMEGETIVMTDIFKYEQTGIGPEETVIGDMKPTGIRPMFSPRLEAAGFHLGVEIFNTGISDIIAQRRRR
jgi:pilus assembly protein CpaF